MTTTQARVGRLLTDPNGRTWQCCLGARVPGGTGTPTTPTASTCHSSCGQRRLAPAALTTIVDVMIVQYLFKLSTTAKAKRGTSSTRRQVSCVSQIELLRQRLLHADSVVGMLAISWAAFELVRSVAGANADRSADMYPAFTFARGAAVSGRNAIAFAPSMRADQAVLFEEAAPLQGDAYEVADTLADLASALSARLRETAGVAGDAGDRAACEDAAREADRITELLAKSQ